MHFEGIIGETEVLEGNELEERNKILLSDLSLVPCSPCVINHVALCPSFGLLNVLCEVFSFCIVITLHHYCVFILKNHPKAWS